MRKTHNLARSPLTIRQRSTPPGSTACLSPTIARIRRQSAFRLHTPLAPPPTPLQRPALPLEANPLFAIYLTARAEANCDWQPKTALPSTYQEYLVDSYRKHHPNGCAMSASEMLGASEVSECASEVCPAIPPPPPPFPSAAAATTSAESTSIAPSKFRSRIPVRCKSTSPPPVDRLSSIVDSDTATASSNEDDASAEELWVFGYGSLVWKVDFPVADSQTGYIKGFHRRFYQHSIDHRGTPERPGRVVTLVPDAAECSPAEPAIVPSTPLSAHAETVRREARVYGVAHRIPNEQRSAVIRHLDHREKNGYDRRTVEFYPYPSLCPKTGAPLARRSICLYLATADNESFAGPLEMPRLAEQVFEARGPSGANVEYVFRLADAMRAMFPGERDDHLFELERLLRVLETRNAPHA